MPFYYLEQNSGKTAKELLKIPKKEFESLIKKTAL